MKVIILSNTCILLIILKLVDVKIRLFTWINGALINIRAIIHM